MTTRILNFAGCARSCQGIDTWSPLVCHDIKFLPTKFHRKEPGGAAGVTASMRPRIAIAPREHHRSMLAGTTFHKDGAHVLSPHGESAHRIWCTHAFPLAKQSENGHRIATLDVSYGLKMILSYISNSLCVKFGEGRSSMQVKSSHSTKKEPILSAIRSQQSKEKWGDDSTLSCP